jgi:hypothetical protein
LDDVFRDDEDCVRELFNKGVFKEKCIPNEKDTAEALAATLDQLDMFDGIYVHAKKEKERLNATTYPQPRRRIYGVIHYEIFVLDGQSVAILYHYPIKNRIEKSICVRPCQVIYMIL